MKSISVVFFLSLWAFVVKAQEQLVKSIEVTGQAKIEVVPDQLFLKVVLAEKESKGSLNLDQLEKRFNKVLNNLKISKEQVYLEDVHSAFTKYWIKKGRKASKVYVVELQTAEQLGVFLSECAAHDISNVSLDHVDYSQRTTTLKSMRIQAIQAAQEKASYMVAAIGAELGGPVHIRIERNYQPRMDNTVVRMKEENDLDNIDFVPGVAFQKITIEASVFCSFEIR